MKIRLVGSELYKVDGRTDRYDKGNFVNAPKKNM